MKRTAIHIISIFFITILLVKGIATVLPYVWDGKNMVTAIVENDAEEKSSNESKSPVSVAEELFDHHISGVHLDALALNTRHFVHLSSSYLPSVCLDVQTPPPNRA